MNTRWSPPRRAKTYSALHVLGHWRQVEFRDMEDTHYIHHGEQPQ